MNMPNRAVRLTVAILSLLAPAAAFAAPFHLLKDVYPGSNSGTTQYLAPNDGHLFFWGVTGSSGLAGQPWTSDGTVSGTFQIGEIIGSSGTFWVWQSPFTHNGIAYFVASDGFTGRQLWRSDGTLPGTFALTSASGSGLPYDWLTLSAIGDEVVFEGGNATDGFALMHTDGTLLGTGTLTSAHYAGGGGVVQKGLLLLPSGTGFVVTDGTPAGTSFFSVTGLTGFANYANFIAAVNETVYFAGTDATHGTELWKTDGTPAGTAIVKDLFVGSSSSNPQALTRVDDTLFFVATTPDAGQELWTSDGTPGGTVRVKDIHPGILDSAPEKLTALNGTLYFVANPGSTGKELWKSDGTDAGTVAALGDFNPGTNGAFDYTYDTVQAINHKLVLVMNPGTGGSAAVPYASDGTLAGTAIVDTVHSIVVNYSGLVPANGQLFASGTLLPSTTGNELIATDAFATLGNTWCANPEQAVPDNLPAGLDSRFHLPNHGGITKLTVSVDIGHTYLGDLTISLRHEQTGTQVTLFDQPSACSGDLLDIVFDDAAASSVQTTCSNARLAYPRDQSFIPANPLAVFSGESLRGDWTLNVADHAAGDIGILHEWCMNFASDLIFADGLD